MIKDDILYILHVEHRHTLVGQVASTETNMAHNTVRLQLQLIACQTDTPAWSRLTSEVRGPSMSTSP